MGRSVSTDLQNLLDLGGCQSNSTLDLYLADGETEFHFTTRRGGFTIDGVTYTDDLRITDELKQTVLTPPDRVNVTVQNVDKAFGGEITSESLTHAVAVFGRYYEDPAETLPSTLEELFRGEAFPTALDESEAKLEIVSDLVAAGFCIGSETLAPNCQNVYKGPECGYTGLVATCNKKRRSPLGCQGHIYTGTTTMEFRFRGMEFPDPIVPSAPDGSGGSPSGDPDYNPPCPRVDQYVLVRGFDGETKPKLAGALSLHDELWDPTTGTFNKIGWMRQVQGEEIYRLVAENGACVFCSASHPVIRDERDETGTPAESMFEGYSMMTVVRKGVLEKSKLSSIRREARPAAVVKIELVGRHIYAAGHTPGSFVVAHNTKPPPFEEVGGLF